MNETQRRIKAYKAAIPDLKERVIAVALLLVMSLAMVTSATFAWLTISTAPEVKGANTTVASNGNLEIALVAPNGSEPDVSAVGDSSTAEGQSITASNITWGNLVNLSDPSYGLDNLTLRPAQLNSSALLTSPLYGAVYNKDGRIEKLSSSFAYATWQPEANGVPGYFLVTDDYGVRAISSTTVEAVGFAQQVFKIRGEAETSNSQAGTDYLKITQNNAWMKSLANVMGLYMTAKINAGQDDVSLTNPTVEKADVQNLSAVFEAFVGVYNQQIKAMVDLLNYQLFLKNNSEEGSTPYTPYTQDTLMQTNVTEAYLKGLGLQAFGLDQMKKDLAKLQENFEKIKALENSGTIKWKDSGINNIVASLMDVGKCTVDGTPVNNIGVSNAMGYITGVHDAVITNGILYNFEYLNGTHCRVEKIGVSAKAKRMGITVPATITANIFTNAEVPSQFYQNLQYADSLNQGAVGVEVAEDTYGLAIDLWVRTNADGSYLTLEGNVLSKTETVRATGVDSSGNIVELYSMSSTDGEGNTVQVELYKDSNGQWYIASTHNPVSEEDMTGTPVEKYKEIQTVVGYEGENRIWEDKSMLSTDSTTQGSGSCYVYYADSPEDQARSLELLNAMKVVFIDAKGVEMATAFMDTEHYYAENGRVTVPLVLQSDSLNLGENFEGETVYAITELERNVATRITAIVYLDGTKLTNEDVLAASDIQGKLNIQFGSSVDLSHAESEALSNATRSVTASVSENKFVYDEALASGTPMSTKVTVNVNGEQPNNVSAFFIRSISSTQGSREEIMHFTQQADGSWTADFTFKAPGTYILRSVDLDGTTYDLSQCPEVEVEGFTITSLTCKEADENNHISVMTANASTTANLSLRFASSDPKAMPKSVQGRFLRSDGSAVNINFTYNATSGTWEGTAKFLTSGQYSMQYLILDGEYTELSAELQQTASVYLGMRAAVYTDSPVNIRYVPSEMADNELNLYMKIWILDNTGARMNGLTDVTLYYAMEGNSLAEAGMVTPLQWNASSGYYEGTFASKIGMYSFGSVTVGSNTINYATTSPNFRIISPDPPVFKMGTTESYQFAPDGNATLKVQIDNAEAATVWAEVVNERNGSVTDVRGELKNGEWVFPVPTDANGYQDGNWRLAKLRLSNVYDKQNNLYTDDDPWIIDLEGEANVSAKVVSRVYVTFPEDRSQNFGTDDAGNVTGTFMQSHTISGLYVDFNDFEGNSVSGISDVKLTFTYGNDSAKYGGYTSDGLTNATAGATVTVALSEEGTGHFVQTENAQLVYAGSYSTEMSYVLNGREIRHGGNSTNALPNNAPEFTVWSNGPTVKVTAVSPTGTFGVNAHASASTGGGFTELTGVSNSFTEYYATVYIRHTGSTNIFGSYYRTFALPSVTLTLSGMPSNFTSATTVFGNALSAEHSTTYTFTPGNGLSKSGEIGYIYRSSALDGNPSLYSAGKQTVDTIDVVYNGNTFRVNLSHELTINQPQFPRKATFTISDSTFTGTVPSPVYSYDGENINITFPTVAPWTVTSATTSNGEFVQQGTPTTRNVYTERSETTGSGCNEVTTTYYTPYIETTTIYTADSSTTTTVTTKQITGWRVGGVTYAPGDTVTLTGDQTITAVITSSSETSTSSTATTRTVIAYTQNGGESTTRPSGSKVTSVAGSTTDKVN